MAPPASSLVGHRRVGDRKCWPRHRANRVRKFLNQIDRAVPAELTVPSGVGQTMHRQDQGNSERGFYPGILATTCTHSHAQFRGLNQVERWFGLTVTTPDQDEVSHYACVTRIAILEFIECKRAAQALCVDQELADAFSTALAGSLPGTNGRP